MTEAPAAEDRRGWAARIAAARERLDGVAHRTPVLTSQTLDARTGARVFLKCENFQRMGAFKFRGAWNAIAQLEGEARRGVVAYSSGNHAQAVALACRQRGIPCVVVMPSTAPAAKLAATRDQGAEIVHDDRAGERRETLATRLAAERGLTLIPPFDHPDIVAGQATATAELIEQAGPLDLLVVPVGGGGLVSGAALTAALAAPNCRVIGVEPAAGDDGVRSFRSGSLVTIPPPETIADGARTPSLGVLTFAIIRRYVADMTSVPDAALIDAMRFALERLKIVVEPTGVLALAALLTGVVRAEGQRVGVIVSGGNLDPALAAAWLEASGAAT
jgi:threonine dehydratase